MHLDLMRRYPKPDRSNLLTQRVEVDSSSRILAKEFNYEYFDGPRSLGLGGFKYIPGYWTPVVEDFISHYQLSNSSSLLDVGCAKGFTMFEFARQLPGMRIKGLDISRYCINNSLPIVMPHITHGCCSNLPFESNSFDLAISIATIHNLDLNGVKRSLKELMRVSKSSFIKVNGYTNDDERLALHQWNLVADTILHVKEWEQIFDEVGYDRDWEFFTP